MSVPSFDQPQPDAQPDAPSMTDAGAVPVVPSNAEAVGELQPTGLVLAPTITTFDTSTQCLLTTPLGRCEVIEREDLDEACVCRMDELVIDQLAVTGTRALVLLAYRKVEITTKLDVSANGITDGPGASRAYTIVAPWGISSGGHGGSFGTSGGKGPEFVGAPLGGNYTINETAVAPTYGAPSLIPLMGGMRGQGREDLTNGAGGGGAVQITAGASITIAGVIDAGGGGGPGGRDSFNESGARGGGSGGGILLEALTVSITGHVVANGGGGGGGGGFNTSMVAVVGASGTNGGLARAEGGRDRAHGCWTDPMGGGGDGSIGSSDGEDGGLACAMADPSWVGAGAGGGGAGRIRINTATACACDGTISPTPSLGTVKLK